MSKLFVITQKTSSKPFIRHRETVKNRRFFYRGQMNSITRVPDPCFQKLVLPALIYCVIYQIIKYKHANSLVTKKKLDMLTSSKQGH